MSASMSASIANHDILTITNNKIAKHRDQMNASKLIQEIVETYQKHGWQLSRVLLRLETRAALEPEPPSLETAEIEDSSFDGLWFSRGSHNNREAWELRLLAESPFALFETFEPDETQEQRDEMRREMEARMRDHVTTVKSNE